MRALALEIAARLEVGDDPLASLVPVQTGIPVTGVIDGGVVGEDRDHRELVPLPGRVVVSVVGRRDLDRTGAKRPIDDLVGDDRDVALDERDPDALSHEVAIAIVVRMDRDGGVAEDRLGPGRRDGDPTGRVRLASGLVDHVVADRPEGARLRRRDDLEVGDARPAAGAPVDQRLRAVREAVVVEALEAHADGACGPLVHREPEPAPVERGADPALLPEHDLAGGVDELPHPLEVPLPAERFATLALLGDDLVEDVLGRDRGVVEPR